MILHNRTCRLKKSLCINSKVIHRAEEVEMPYESLSFSKRGKMWTSGAPKQCGEDERTLEQVPLRGVPDWTSWSWRSCAFTCHSAFRVPLGTPVLSDLPAKFSRTGQTKKKSHDHSVILFTPKSRKNFLIEFCNLVL